MTKRRTIAIVMAALLVGALAMLGISSAFAWDPGGQGRGLFGGMMGGSGYGGMMSGWSGQSTQPQGDPIGMDKAVQAVQGYIDRIGNNDLAVDEVMEFQDNFYAIVKEKSTGTGAFELLVDKYTAGVFPEHGPNMMWNTNYGMMAGGAGCATGGGHSGMMGGMMGNGHGGMMGGQYGTGPNTAAGPMSVTAEQARAAAQTWLDQNQQGSTTEAPDKFYGYYTVHTLKEGKTTGMLSVNGYTGQVWYHTWHGGFVRSNEVGQ